MSEQTLTAVPHFGRIVDGLPFGGGPHGRTSTHLVRDDEDGQVYSFDYSDIVTEGFRTTRTGEHVRFLVSPGTTNRACYVLRLDQPDTEAYYR